MPKNPAAVALGQVGGKAKSLRKALAAAANGKRGGRPRKPPPLPEPVRPPPAC